MRTRIELFELAGKALTPGAGWRAALAVAMNVRPDSIRQLLSGRMTLHDGHLHTMLAAMVKQREELERAELELRAWLAKQGDVR